MELVRVEEIVDGLEFLVGHVMAEKLFDARLHFLLQVVSCVFHGDWFFVG